MLVATSQLRFQNHTQILVIKSLEFMVNFAINR